MLNQIESKSSPYLEKSIFHTNEPRDGKTKVHLLLVFSCFLSALVIAIIFAENQGTKFPMAAQRTLLNQQK